MKDLQQEETKWPLSRRLSSVAALQIFGHLGSRTLEHGQLLGSDREAVYQMHPELWHDVHVACLQAASLGQQRLRP